MTQLLLAVWVSWGWSEIGKKSDDCARQSVCE